MTNAEEEIAAKRDEVEKLHEAQAAAAEILRACDEAKAKADAAYAAAQTPQTKKAVRDAREDVEDAKIVADAATANAETAQTEVAAMEHQYATARFAALQRDVIGLDAIHRRFAPHLERARSIREQEIALGRDIDAEFAALRRDFEAAGVAARAAGQNSPRLNFSVNELREMIIRNLRSNPFPSGVTSVHEMMDAQASIYAVGAA